jgi:hypothetical protein
MFLADTLWEEEKMSSEAADIRDKIKEILEKVGNKREDLIPILQQTKQNSDISHLMLC